MKFPSLAQFRSIVWCASAAALLLGFAGCGDQKAAAPSSGNQTASASPIIHLVFIPKGMQHVYWKSVQNGMLQAQKEANDAGQNVQIDWVGPPNEGDRAGQIDVLEQYIAKKSDGIILCPMDADALAPGAAKATEAGIPLVIVDSAINYDKIESFVATDNEKAGELAGEELAKELGGKGNVIMMRFMAGSASTNYREDGFLAVMKKYPDIKVLSSEDYAGDTREKAQDKGLNLLNTYKNQGVDGIFTPNEPTTNGMLLALEGAGLAGKVKFVGFDGGEANMAGFDKGELNAVILQDPYKMGYLGVKTMLDHLAGKPVEKRIDTGTAMLTKETKDSPAIKELLAHTASE